MTDAALLSVFTIANENGTFDVSIKDLPRPAGNEMSDDQIAAIYAKELKSFVLNHPDQWNGWHSFKELGEKPG